jgi:hypothetical protein
MLVITHALVGGFIVSKIPNLVVSSPLIFGSHFLLDRIPHWDLGAGFRQRKKIVNFLLGCADLLSAIGICWFVFQKNFPFNPVLWAGVFFSLLPDFLEFPPLFLGWRFFPFGKLETFHSQIIHRRTKFPQGLIPQILIIAGILLLV